MVELYLHSSICLRGIAFNYFSTGNKIIETRGPNTKVRRRRRRNVTAIDISTSWPVKILKFL
jgi:hypothetical protein